MNKDNSEPNDRKNKKTMFDRINKKSRSKKDNLDPKNGERHNAEKPPETGQGKVTW